MEATEVLNLATGEVIVYTLPPEGAVKAAFLQFIMKDFMRGTMISEMYPWCAEREPLFVVILAP